MQEIILSKPINGYPDYIIYSDGRVFSKRLNRFLICNHGEGFYKSVRLNKGNGPKTFHLHRLLALAFIPNPENKTDVNHKDANKLNNSLDNLEWCTHKENMRHAWELGLVYISEKNVRAATEAKFKPVLNTETGIFYDSIKQAAESIGWSHKKLGDRLRGRFKNNTYLRMI